MTTLATITSPPSDDTTIPVPAVVTHIGNDEGWSALATTSCVRVYRNAPGTLVLQVRARGKRRTAIASAELSSYYARELMRALMALGIEV